MGISESPMCAAVHNTEPVRDASRPQNYRRVLAISGACALALVLSLTALAAAYPTGSPRAGTGLALENRLVTSYPSESWAWGAAANLSLQYTLAGAYNGLSSIGGGNLTENGTYVVLHEAGAIGYAVYVVVAAQGGPNGSLYVTVHAEEYAAEQFAVAASGTFPAAGTYNATTPIHLVPMNFSLNASVATLTAVSGYLNYTSGTNGTVLLLNEHLEVLKGIALSLTANQYPNVTRDSSGNTVLKYVSGSVAEDAWVAVNFSAAFNPAFVLVQAPVQIGENWLTNSTATVNGTVAFAAQYAASVPGGPSGQWSQSGSSHLSTTAAISMECNVVGTQTVRLPDGSTETDYVIEYTVESGSSNWTVADGLFLLPGGNGSSTSVVSAAVPEEPAKASMSASPSSAASARSLYSPAKGLPDSGKSNPSGAGPVTAAPMSPAAATSAMTHLRSPHVDLPGPAGIGAGIVLLAVTAIGASLVGILLWHRRQMRRIG